jgi:hypothetical protein
MRNKLTNSFLFVSILFIFILNFFYGCGDSSVQSSGDHISGYVTFTDTNLIPGGYYAISIYNVMTNPFDTLPLRSDALTMTLNGNVYKDYFKLTNIPNGSYYFAVTWIKNSAPNFLPVVLGTRGCDTNHQCTNHTVVPFPNYSYEDCNILSWTDTTKKLNH